jgi:hypothetical protein
MTTFASVVIGVVSSLIATLLFLGLAELVKKVLLPWAEDMIYRGVRVDGRWVDADKPDKSKIESVLELKQKADRITGIYSHEKAGEAGSKSVYRVAGEIRNTYLNASLWPISDKMVDSGTLLVRVYHRDSLLWLEGTMTYISSDTGKIESTSVRYKNGDS